jgi:hypothetical protein
MQRGERLEVAGISSEDLGASHGNGLSDHQRINCRGGPGRSQQTPGNPPMALTGCRDRPDSLEHAIQRRIPRPSADCFGDDDDRNLDHSPELQSSCEESPRPLITARQSDHRS